MCRYRGLPAELDEDKWLLSWVYRRSLTTAKSDAWRLYRKNSKTIWLAIKQSKREATEALDQRSSSGSRTGRPASQMVDRPL
ncbi:Phosphorylated carbohydrates phosphatase [Hordeum vulgare]|nr:Phosphorylated carbohydrates phosphatase [Hordeum vulgare]